MIRVMLVDDQAMIRQGLRMILDAEATITVVGEAADGRDALDVAERARPDVVLLDLRMPRIEGVEEHRRRCDAAHAPRVLMLTTFDLDEHVFAALDAGAAGFLLKDAPAEHLVDAICIVHDGEALLAPSVTRRVIEKFGRRPRPDGSDHSWLAELTDRETEVLRCIARGRSNGEIAAHLHLGEATVKTHVGRILAKLGARDRVQVVIAAYESGLVAPGDETPAR
ncbi:response regulator transcription factor [soil metagenome]